ncbi:MAG: adenylate/guanylate cyclase domain-containing protein [Candidatus Firestonebacteria bacterium]|nr:adenylate/guanylate cyclase domain-containing protein [Candidatus Firestonebacteria bacterium]
MNKSESQFASILLYSSLITIGIISILFFLFHSTEKSLSYMFYDLKLKICGKYRSDPHNIREKIVTISVDEIKTIPQIGYPSPNIHAKMIEKLVSYKVNSIFYDFIFKGDVPDSLVQATKDAGNIYWTASFNLTRHEKEAFLINEYTQNNQEIIKNNSLKFDNKTGGFWKAKVGVFPNEAIAKAAKGVGHISTDNDENSENDVFRKVALFLNIDGYLFPSVNLLLVCDYLKVPRNNIFINPGESIILLDAQYPDGTKKDIEIPINENGEMLINYIKPWKINVHNYLEPFWFVTVLNPNNKPEWDKELKERLKDKICLIGNASSINKDIHNIPIETNYPGIGIHAHILYTILSENFIKEVPFFYTLIFTISIMGIFAYFVQNTNISITLLIAFSCMIIYSIFSYTLFVFSGLSPDDIFPIAGILIFGFSVAVFKFIYAEKEREKLELAFNSYLSPQILKMVIHDQKSLTLDGRLKELTILFSDIVGFSTLAEKITPVEIKILLNEYFTEMTDIVFKYEGTVDKFIGDGMLAFFGDPISYEDHAYRAVMSAMEMQKKVRELNEKWNNEGKKHTIKIRIGINTGRVTVGNMGSERRMEYTVIGKEVNLAQRLESSATPGKILISNRTYSFIIDKIKAINHGEIEVKGMSEKVKTYEVDEG